MAASYPQYILNRGELSRLEDAIVEEISSGRFCDVKLHFEGIHYKPGMLLLDCASNNTAKWLIEIAASLPNWKGVPLHACLSNKVPSQNTVSVYLPRSGNKNAKQLLAMIMNQNEGINTNLWKVVQSRRAGRGGTLLTMSIDHQSLNFLRLKDFNLWYRFGHAHVHLHKKIVLAESSNAASSQASNSETSTSIQLENDDNDNGNLIDLTDDENEEDDGGNVTELIHDLIHEVEEGLQENSEANRNANNDETNENTAQECENDEENETLELHEDEEVEEIGTLIIAEDEAGNECIDDDDCVDINAIDNISDDDDDEIE